MKRQGAINATIAADLLNSMDLINPLSILSGEKPVIKKTMHWYLKLQDFEERLIDWIKSKENWKDNVRNFVTPKDENHFVRASDSQCE